MTALQEHKVVTVGRQHMQGRRVKCQERECNSNCPLLQAYSVPGSVLNILHYLFFLFSQYPFDVPMFFGGSEEGGNSSENLVSQCTK